MYDEDIFEILHKIPHPYIEKYDFYTTLEFYEFLDLRAHTRVFFSNGHQIPGDGTLGHYCNHQPIIKSSHFCTCLIVDCEDI